MSRSVRLILVDASGEPLGALPAFGVDLPWWAEVETVAAGAHALGVELRVLRLVDVERGRFMRDGLVSYTAELVGSLPSALVLDPVPKGLPLADEPLRAPWARPGWIAGTLAWADAALQALGTPRVGPAVQTKAWNLSSVLRLPVSGGRVWCKSVPPFLAHEGAVVAWLARDRASPVPELLAADAGRASVLLADLGPDEQWGAPEPRLLRMLRELVSLQARSAGDVDALLGLGVPDLRATALAREVRQLAGRADVRSTLDPAERSDVDALVAELPGRLRELAAAGLPDTLVHGDFHPGNWIARGEDLVLMDWGDSFVGHPLIDTDAFVEQIEDGAVRERVLATWADAWRDALPGSDPARALAAMPPIAALQRALKFQTFLDGIEPSERRFHATDVPDYLRQAIAAATG